MAETSFIARPHLLVAKEDAKSTESISEEEKFEEIEAALRRLDTGRLRAITKEDIIFQVKRQMGVELVDSNLMLPADFDNFGRVGRTSTFSWGPDEPGGQGKATPQGSK